MKQTPLGKAFLYAFDGIIHFFSHDRNGRIHLAVSAWVVIGGFYFTFSIHEWMAVLLCIGLVISLEMLNHALEKLCDMVHPVFHPGIKIVKDVAAAAVFWSALMSAIIGLLIFVPKIMAAI
jgi:undecaprenol kinase/diacylglycerol kinase (ATP)